jgi:hypothetical protein
MSEYVTPDHDAAGSGGMMIRIMSKSHPDLAESLGGGGKICVDAEYPATPKNLIRATNELVSLIHIRKNSLGNIGCGQSWISIGNKTFECHMLQFELFDSYAPDGAISPTQRAHKILSGVWQTASKRPSV